jgi:hypothetical protein
MNEDRTREGLLPAQSSSSSPTVGSVFVKTTLPALSQTRSSSDFPGNAQMAAKWVALASTARDMISTEGPRTWAWPLGPHHC